MSAVYESPLSSRYASGEMLYLFSNDFKFRTWRRLWVALARAECKLGLPVTEAQVKELEANVDNIDYGRAAEYEKRLRHDVMAHIHAYGDVCPSARPIIHLGATSMYVGDNTDIIIMREALLIIRKKLLSVIALLRDFAMRYKSLPTLGFTHFQPAQLTTVGKRATLWMLDLLFDVDELSVRIDSLKLLGNKGTTGTQASFLELFGGDAAKVAALEREIAAEMGFSDVYPVSGQTYSRKVDYAALSALSGVAQSAYKFAGDMRLLSHLKEVEEPFEGGQIGSSAMPYKRNPMRCERICALARYVMADAQNPAMTASSQWLERTLDDSANRRIAIPEAFLAVDAILNIYMNVAGGMRVYEKVIKKHVMEELPFMATENILMNAVKKGGDRQSLHERIRLHSIEAGKTVKELGLPNNLLELIAGDAAFGLTPEEIRAGVDPALFIGLSAEQTEAFIRGHIDPALAAFPREDGAVPELKV